MHSRIHRYGTAFAAALVLGMAAVAIGMATGLIRGRHTEPPAEREVATKTASDSEGKAMLRALYKSIPVMSEGEAWHLRYSVAATNRDDGSVQVSEADIVMTATGMQLVSDEMEVYQDEKTAVTVLPSEQTIYVADRGKVDTQKWMDMFNAFRDSIVFSYCDVVACREVHAPDGAKLTQITLAVKPDAAGRINKRYPVRSFVIEFDRETNRIDNYTTNFIEPYILESMTVTLREIDYNYNSDKLPATAGGKYLAADYKVRPAYNSYTVVDMRVKR